jgi:hypothetical protein
MTKQQALQILIDQETKVGKIDDTIIEINPADIRHNIRYNGFELNMDYIQDMTSIHKLGGYELYQGHSLKEVKFKGGIK